MEAQLFISKISANFNLRKPKGERPTPIFLVIRFGKQQLKFNTGAKVLPAHWDKKKQRCLVTASLSTLDNRNNNMANTLLLGIKVKYAEMIKYLGDNPDEISKDTILGKMGNATHKKIANVCLYLGNLIEKQDLSEGSKRTYMGTIQKLKEYKPEATLDEVATSIFFNEFKDWLMAYTFRGTKLQVSRINELLSKLRTTLSFAVKDNKLDKVVFNTIIYDPIKGKIEKEDNAISLTDKEIMALYHHKTKSPLEEQVRDLFILECTTGQRFSDINKITIEETDGICYYSLFTQKKGTKVEVPILFTYAKEILVKYNGSLPVVSNVTMNKTIKSIAKDAGICGIERISKQDADGKQVVEKERYNCISTHTGRRTFITALVLRNYTAEKIKYYSGHRDSRMVELYTKCSPKEIMIFDHLKEEEKIPMLLAKPKATFQ